jgi:hypothetical protein
MRFLVRWIASEKRKESVSHISFGFHCGGLTLFAYALHRLGPVFHPRRESGNLCLLSTSIQYEASNIISPKPIPSLIAPTSDGGLCLDAFVDAMPDTMKQVDSYSGSWTDALALAARAVRDLTYTA